jgi:hypothetical protein
VSKLENRRLRRAARWFLDNAMAKTSSLAWDVHFDELDLEWNSARGADLIQPACRLLEETSAEISNRGSDFNLWRVFIAFPLEESPQPTPWLPSFWNEIGASATPPSLLIAKNGHLLSEPWEEYHRPVELPIPAPAGIFAVYRRYRSFLAMQAGWEYCRGIYLAKPLS